MFIPYQGTVSLIFRTLSKNLSEKLLCLWNLTESAILSLYSLWLSMDRRSFAKNHNAILHRDKLLTRRYPRGGGYRGNLHTQSTTPGMVTTEV